MIQEIAIWIGCDNPAGVDDLILFDRLSPYIRSSLLQDNRPWKIAHEAQFASSKEEFVNMPWRAICYMRVAYLHGDVMRGASKLMSGYEASWYIKCVVHSALPVWMRSFCLWQEWSQLHYRSDSVMFAPI